LKIAPPPVDFRSLPRQKVFITFAGVLLAIFISTLDQTIVATAMPKIVSDLGGFSHYTIITTAYLVTSTVVIPITGRLTDIFGRKWFYTAGITIFVLGSLLSGLSRNLSELVAFRAFQGVGAGIMIACAFAVIGDLFPPAERGKYQGFISMIFGLSSIIGPSLGGYITDTFSWHWIFFINIPVGTIVIILFFRFFPYIRPQDRSRSLDYKGITLLILTVVPLLLGLSWGGVDYPWLSPQIVGMLVFSGVMAALLLMVERRAKEPLLPLRYFTDRIVSIANAVTLLSGFAMFGAIIFVPLYFQGVLGQSAAASGSSLTPMMLGVVFGSLAAGQLMSRAGGHYRTEGIVGIAAMAVGLYLLSHITSTTSYPLALIFIILTGLGLGATFPIYPIAAQNSVPYKVMGAVVSSIPFSRFMGGTLGLAILGSIVNNRFGAHFLSSLPDQLKSALSPQQLAALSHNPQNLIGTQGVGQSGDVLSSLGLPPGTDLTPIFQDFRESLVAGITEAFLIAFFVVLAAWLLNLFIKEIPLRKQHVQKGEQAAG
jgi:EmrB/QacA subfamily drug resistance transporter